MGARQAGGQAGRQAQRAAAWSVQGMQCMRPGSHAAAKPAQVLLQAMQPGSAVTSVFCHDRCRGTNGQVTIPATTRPIALPSAVSLPGGAGVGLLLRCLVYDAKVCAGLQGSCARFYVYALRSC